MSKDFKNQKTKRREVKQLFRYFKNQFGTDSNIQVKNEEDIPKIIKKEGLEDSYIENNDLC